MVQIKKLDRFNNIILISIGVLAILFAISEIINQYIFSVFFTGEDWFNYIFKAVINEGLAVIICLIGGFKRIIYTPIILTFFIISWINISITNLINIRFNFIPFDYSLFPNSVLRLILSILIVISFINLIILKKDDILSKLKSK